MNKETNEIIRLLILDTEGLYTQIYDEVYVPKDDINKIKEKYAGYMIVEVFNIPENTIKHLK